MTDASAPSASSNPAPDVAEPPVAARDRSRLTWLQRRSFGTQLALLLAVLVAVLTVSLTALITSMMRAQIERDKGAALATLGRSVTLALGKNFRDRMQQVQLLADSPELWDRGTAGPKVSQALARMKRVRPFPSWIGVADSAGNVVAATDDLLVGRSVKDRPWFLGGLRGPYVGDVHEAKLLARLLPANSPGEPLRFVDFAVPLTVAERVVGVIGLHADVQGVRAVAEALLPKNAAARRLEIYILSRTGEVIFGADRSASIDVDALARTLDAQAPVSAAEQARPAVDFTWGDGSRYLTAVWSLDQAAPDLRLGWQVLVRQPAAVAYEPATRVASKALVAGLVCALVAVALGLILGRQLTIPLRRIALAARDVESGTPGAVIPHAAHNQELSQLSSALQAMTGRLEQLVEERTAQLNVANHELRVLGEEQSAMLDNELVGIVRLNMTDRVAIWSNRAMARIFGYTMEELHQKPARLLYPDDRTYEKVGQEAREAFAQGRDYITTVQLRRHDGEPIWIHLQGALLKERPGESQWMMTDVTAQHQYQEKVEHIAFHDALTGLPNRLLLADRVKQAAAASLRSTETCAVAFIDLDGFKAVNDLYGHDAGDQLLREIADRAKASVRAGDTVARIGGDEFVVVLTALESRTQCEGILQRLLETIKQPVEFPDGLLASVSASIGVAMCPGDGSRPESLLAAADAAMYEAKHAGKTCIRFASLAPQERFGTASDRETTG